MKRRRGSKPAKPPFAEAEASIEGFAPDGGGFARVGDVALSAPLTLPGDRVRLRPERRDTSGLWRARAIERLEKAPRATPICPHFGACGGCALQHAPEPVLASFTRDQIATRLARAGVTAPAIDPTWIAARASRRRARLAFGERGQRRVLGYRRAGSHAIEPVAACPILVPELERLLGEDRPALDALLAAAAPEGGGEIALAHHASADEAARLDVVLIGRFERRRDPERIEALGAAARALGLARLGAGETIAEVETILAFTQPTIAIGRFRLVPPLGGFAQPTAASEAFMRAFAEKSLAGARKVADLYAGHGALGLGLEGPSSVDLYESADDAHRACAAAIARAPGSGRRALRRDLAAAPLRPDELARLDGVVLDPPRAGALAQSRMLAETAAKGRAPRLVYISCDPKSFARDASILTEAGYSLESLAPIHHFLYASEIELAAAFTPP